MPGNFGGAPVPFTGQIYQPDNSIPQLILQAGAQRAALEQNLYRNVGDTVSSLGQIPMQMQALAMQKQEMGLKAAQEARAQAQADRETAALQHQQSGLQALSEVSGPDVTPDQIQDHLSKTGHADMIPLALKNKTDSLAAVDAYQQHTKDLVGGELFRSVAPYLDKPDLVMDGLQLAATHLKKAGVDPASIDQVVSQAQQNPSMVPSLVRGLIAQSSSDKQFQETYNKTQTVGSNIVRQTPEGKYQTLYTAPISAEEAEKNRIEQQRVNVEAGRAATERAGKIFEATGEFPPGFLPTNPNAPTGGTIGGDLHGDAYLASLGPNNPLAATIKAYAEGRMPVSPRNAATSPILKMVNQYDPSFTAADFQARMDARKDFVGGGKTSDQIKSLNQVVEHLSDLSDKADELHNFQLGGVVPGTTALNYIWNKAAASAGNPALGNFELTRQAVVSELERAWRQGGGSEKDMEAWKGPLSSAATPTELKGAIATMAKAIEAPVNALENKRDQNLGAGAKGINVLTPASRAILDRLQGKGKITTADAYVASLNPQRADASGGAP